MVRLIDSQLSGYHFRYLLCFCVSGRFSRWPRTEPEPPKPEPAEPPEPNRSESIEQSEPDEPECMEPGNPETETNRNEPGPSWNKLIGLSQ